MPFYRATRRYRAIYMTPDGEERLGFEEGDVVSLPEAKAAWINRDSRGVLEPAPEERQVRQAPRDRMQRPRENRQEPITKADFKAVRGDR